MALSWTVLTRFYSGLKMYVNRATELADTALYNHRYDTIFTDGM